MENLFQNFTRLEEHKNRNIEGTGLGLSLTKRLVDMMHGEVQVESQYGEGSTFTAIIPQKVICEDGIGDMKQIFENYELSVGAMMPVPQFAGVHILVVDDMEMNRIVAKEMLLQTGAIVDVAGSGEEGLTLMKEQHYDLIFMDQMMPDMDGIETARQIRKRIGKEITIIVLTSYEFSEIEEDAKAAGVDAFIAKPLFRSRLTATLRQFVSDKKEKTARNYLENLSEADYTGKRILLVEDNELNREIAVEILQMTGAEVETAENGKIAVEKVEVSPKDRYDLIFMDIQMPVLNGYQATAAIRSLPGEKGELPIVAMTANAFAEDVQLAKNTGMNGHIAKPLDMNKLSDVLKKWL